MDNDNVIIYVVYKLLCLNIKLGIKAWCSYRSYQFNKKKIAKKYWWTAPTPTKKRVHTIGKVSAYFTLTIPCGQIISGIFVLSCAHKFSLFAYFFLSKHNGLRKHTLDFSLSNMDVRYIYIDKNMNSEMSFLFSFIIRSSTTKDAVKKSLMFFLLFLFVVFHKRVDGQNEFTTPP